MLPPILAGFAYLMQRLSLRLRPLGLCRQKVEVQHPLLRRRMRTYVDVGVLAADRVFFETVVRGARCPTNGCLLGFARR